MVELPCIIEAMKTLDYFNYFKSQDAGQCLYVHAAPKIENFIYADKEEVVRVATEFWPVRDDHDFTEQLYRRGELANQLKQAMENGAAEYPFDNV